MKQQPRQAWAEDNTRSLNKKPVQLKIDFDVDPAVLQKAKPLLTGNPEADRDIIKFYEARHRLVHNT